MIGSDWGALHGGLVRRIQPAPAGQLPSFPQVTEGLEVKELPAPLIPATEVAEAEEAPEAETADEPELSEATLEEPTEEGAF